MNEKCYAQDAAQMTVIESKQNWRDAFHLSYCTWVELTCAGRYVRVIGLIGLYKEITSTLLRSYYL